MKKELKLKVKTQKKTPQKKIIKRKKLTIPFFIRDYYEPNKVVLKSVSSPTKPLLKPEQEPKKEKQEQNVSKIKRRVSRKQKEKAAALLSKVLPQSEEV